MAFTSSTSPSFLWRKRSKLKQLTPRCGRRERGASPAPAKSPPEQRPLGGRGTASASTSCCPCWASASRPTGGREDGSSLSCHREASSVSGASAHFHGCSTVAVSVWEAAACMGQAQRCSPAELPHCARPLPLSLRCPRAGSPAPTAASTAACSALEHGIALTNA